MSESEKFLEFVIGRWDSIQIDFSRRCGCNHDGLISLTKRSNLLQLVIETVPDIFTRFRIIKANRPHIGSHHNHLNICLINQACYLNVLPKVNVTNNFITFVDFFKNSYFIIDATGDKDLTFIFCCDKGEDFSIVF